MSDTKQIERCGFLAFLMMLVLGTLFGIIGVVLAHIVMKFYAQYYLMLIIPLIMAVILGFGLSSGVKIGRCTRLNLIGILLVLLFSMVCYGGLLFLNDYHDQYKPVTIPDEALLLIEDGQNFLHELPYVGDYVPPFGKPAAEPAAESTDATGAEPAEESSQTPAADQHLGTAVADFIGRFPELAQQPLVIGNIFDLALLTPIRNYLIYPGITEWLAATGDAANADGEPLREHGQLILSQNFASAWMLWSVEFLLVFLVALLNARGAAKKALKTRIRKLQKAGLNVDPTPGKKKKEKPKKKVKTSLIEDVEISPDLNAAPAGEASEAEPAQGKKKKAKPPKPPKEKKVAPPKEKKGFFGFGRKKKTDEQGEGVEPGVGSVEMNVSEDQTLYALILQQYNPTRESDLVQLIQQVGQMPPDKARRLLKTPSLLKRDVSAQDAKFAIDKFNQVQAQVKLITMEQLAQIQQKQQGGPSAPPPAPSKAAPAPLPSPPGSPGEHYALILKRIEPSRQREILELLSSLSGKPADQLQKTLKPPALVLRDATRDEVMMIAQQFQNLQAEVQSVTMSQLQQLMAKSKK